MTDVGGRIAVFRFDEFSFSITLNKGGVLSDSGSPKGSPKTAEKILGLIREHSEISTSQIGERLGISKRAVLKHTSMLKDAGLLSFVGPARGGHWVVTGEG